MLPHRCQFQIITNKTPPQSIMESAKTFTELLVFIIVSILNIIVRLKICFGISFVWTYLWFLSLNVFANIHEWLYNRRRLWYLGLSYVFKSCWNITWKLWIVLTFSVLVYYTNNYSLVLSFVFKIIWIKWFRMYESWINVSSIMNAIMMHLKSSKLHPHYIV